MLKSPQVYGGAFDGRKPFVVSNVKAPLPIGFGWGIRPRQRRAELRDAARPARFPVVKVKASSVASPASEKAVSAKAVVTVKRATGGIYLERGLDDIADLLGKSLLLQLVSAEIDSGTHLSFLFLLTPSLRSFNFQTIILFPKYLSPNL